MMPPKQQPKANLAKKQKQVEDKTFRDYSFRVFDYTREDKFVEEMSKKLFQKFYCSPVAQDSGSERKELDHRVLDVDDDDDDDDDVLVVGQMGEIACRDFPHPRHSCAKYSFNSTSHDKYCDMCYCYVCDIRAPCPYWCIGVSNIDHCHANDKEKIWKNQREYLRTGNMPTEPSSKSTQNILRLSHNTLPRNQVGIRPCSSSTRVPNPSNSRDRYRTRQSTPHNQGLQSRPVQSLSSVRNIVIQKDRNSCMLNPRLYGNRNGNAETDF